MTQWPVLMALAALMLLGSGVLLIGCVLGAAAVILTEGLRSALSAPHVSQSI